MGWGDPGVYGGGIAVGAATPNIDRLARDGLQLMNTYSQPSSTPTRAAIMTGQLPIRTGMLRPMLPGEGAGGRGIDAKATLAQKLKEAGYVTRAVGKWHLGAFKARTATERRVRPLLRHPHSSDDYTAWREPWRNPDLINDSARKDWASKGEVMAIVEGRAVAAVGGSAEDPKVRSRQAGGADPRARVSRSRLLHAVRPVASPERS